MIPQSFVFLCVLGFTTNSIAAPLTETETPAPLPVAPLARQSGSSTKPAISEHPVGFIASGPGDYGRLYCRATGNPPPKITWKKDGNPLATTSVRDVVRMSTGDLMFQRIRDKGPDFNTGVYQCVATNTEGVAYSRNASVQLAYIKNTFRISPINEVAIKGQQTALQCQPPRGFPEPSITWKKGGRSVVPNRRIQIRNSNLVITRALKGDAGTYVCVATNKAGSVQSDPATLKVYEPPRFVAEPVAQTAKSGHSVTLECRATGDPKPQITWSKNKGEIPFERTEQMNNGNLQINELRTSDQGRYTCTATNRVGTITTNAYLTVEGMPEFTELSVNAEVEIGKTATLTCRAKGNPQPSIAWKDLNGREVFPGQSTSQLNNMFVTDDGDLVIYNVHFRDDGIYLCRAINSIGISSTDVRLQIKPRMSTIPPPVIRRGPQNATSRTGSTVTFACVTDKLTSPRPDILWYKDGIQLSNSGKVTANYGNLRITNAMSDDAGRYTCKVMNDYGMSSWNAWLRIVESGRNIPTQPDVDDFPSAPGAPLVVNTTSTTIAVRWQASGHPGTSPILHYDVEYYNIGSRTTSWERRSKVKDTVCIVKGLNPLSNYVFLVRAVNSKGYSDPSAISQNIKTKEIRRPQTPIPQTPEQLQEILDEVNIRLTQVIQFHHAPDPTGSIRLMWATESSCEDIDKFVIAWQPVTGDDSSIQHATAPCTASSYDLASVPVGVTYQIRIKPFRDSLKGKASPIAFVSLRQGKIPPQLPKITPKLQSDGTVVLYWAPPSDIAEDRITGYSVRCRTKDDSYTNSFYVNGSKNEATIRDLPQDGVLALSVTYSTMLGEGTTSPEAEVELGVPLPDVPEQDFVSMLQKQPAIIAGIAIGVVALIAAIAGGVCYYKRSKRNKKARGLHVRSFSFTPQSGPHRITGGPRFDGSIPYSPAFQIAPVGGGGVGGGGMGGGGSDGVGGARGAPGGADNSRMFSPQRQDGMMHNPSNVTKNAIVTYDVKNETVSNSLDEKPTGVGHAGFSYVTDQLTSMSDIPPQFSKTNLSRPSIASTQSCPVQQQMQHHHQQLMRNRSGNSNVFSSDLESSRFHDTSSSAASNVRSVGDLPPPPPSPPLSQRTAVSDRSRGSSSAMHSTGERSSRGQRSRRRPQGGSTNMGTGATAQYASTKFTNVDTDTGIDSPHQTPSPQRPVAVSSPAPPTPPIRGASVFPYGRGQPVMQFNDTQDPTLNLGYLAGPSEGDTDVENDAVGRLNARQFVNDSCQRNSVAVSAVSMMNTYGSESDPEQTSSEPETSDDESLQMESVSQVGQNRALLDEEEPAISRPNPQPRHFKPAPHQHNDRQYAYHTHPANIDEGQPLINATRQDVPSTKPRPNRRPGNKARRQRASNKDLSRVNSVSSSTSSSYQHNTGDSGMSAGVGCSTEHSSLNSNASAGSGAVSRSRTAGNLSSYDVAVTNDHVTSEEELLRHQDGNFSSPTSPTASCVSEQSGYHSTGSSCWQYHEPHTVDQQMPRRHPRPQTNGESAPAQQQHSNTHSLGERNTNYPKAQQRYYPNTMTGSSPLMQDCASAPTGGIDSGVGGGAQFQVARTVLVGGIGGKMARGRPQELSDVPEVSTSDFCEDYSDQSQ